MVQFQKFFSITGEGSGPFMEFSIYFFNPSLTLILQWVTLCLHFFRWLWFFLCFLVIQEMQAQCAPCTNNVSPNNVGLSASIGLIKLSRHIVFKLLSQYSNPIFKKVYQILITFSEKSDQNPSTAVLYSCTWLHGFIVKNET